MNGLKSVVLSMALMTTMSFTSAAEPLRSEMQAQLRKDAIAKGAAPGVDLEEQIKKEFAWRDTMEAYAKSKGLDKKAETRALYRLAEQEANVRAVVDYEKAQIVISEETLKSDYDLRFPSQKQVKVQLALFKEPTQGQKMFEDVKSGKISLTDAARQSTDDTVGAKDGELGFVALSALPPELAVELDKLKEGESLAHVVLTKYGIFFGKIEAIKVAPEKTWEEAKPDLKKQREELALKERLNAIGKLGNGESKRK